MPALASPPIGRFAPSPSGPLHFGSLVAAVASYLQAKSQAGSWLVRMEDIDEPRTQAGAADAILSTLEQFGLEWDGPVWYQSQRKERYQYIFDQLQQQGLLYGCDCPRKAVAAMGGIYNGHCRQRKLSPKPSKPLAWRLRVDTIHNQFDDRYLGRQSLDASLCQEDYVIKRRDGLFAYQLVVVVDDWDQGITEVIRGADLLTMTCRQQQLFQRLGATPPQYGHIPLASTAPGLKLSKQNHAPALDPARAVPLLLQALSYLGQETPAELADAQVDELIAYATRHWQPARIPRQTEILL
ncbi:tRNA glutamyl-Q(34) synthetase GluQRS [Alkalimonas delamerensis]|uniref:Glutamyl-Q tRNA(Asp) synthetase n=1 Tax=Alkalimonas delamerensis TaxID=265981 RepID=A0ABT9GLI7_9GAMM|nr:tRNA glutamyl-Q(34) synthetase GluQRS [Alkalimonas delamerensis]MDP4527804.1 tRNA glutamyl-Q(34) synthetase GluQRS [Alkalimonas delamerensis]